MFSSIAFRLSLILLLPCVTYQSPITKALDSTGGGIEPIINSSSSSSSSVDVSAIPSYSKQLRHHRKRSVDPNSENPSDPAPTKKSKGLLKTLKSFQKMASFGKGGKQKWKCDVCKSVHINCAPQKNGCPDCTRNPSPGGAAPYSPASSSSPVSSGGLDSDGETDNFSFGKTAISPQRTAKNLGQGFDSEHESEELAEQLARALQEEAWLSDGSETDGPPAAGSTSRAPPPNSAAPPGAAYRPRAPPPGNSFSPQGMPRHPGPPNRSQQLGPPPPHSGYGASYNAQGGRPPMYGPTGPLGAPGGPTGPPNPHGRPIAMPPAAPPNLHGRPTGPPRVAPPNTYGRPTGSPPVPQTNPYGRPTGPPPVPQTNPYGRPTGPPPVPQPNSHGGSTGQGGDQGPRSAGPLPSYGSGAPYQGYPGGAAPPPHSYNDGTHERAMVPYAQPSTNSGGTNDYYDHKVPSIDDLHYCGGGGTLVQLQYAMGGNPHEDSYADHDPDPYADHYTHPYANYDTDRYPDDPNLPLPHYTGEPWGYYSGHY